MGYALKPNGSYRNDNRWASFAPRTGPLFPEPLDIQGALDVIAQAAAPTPKWSATVIQALNAEQAELLVLAWATISSKQPSLICSSSYALWLAGSGVGVPVITVQGLLQDCLPQQQMQSPEVRNVLDQCAQIAKRNAPKSPADSQLGKKKTPRGSRGKKQAGAKPQATRRRWPKPEAASQR